MAIHPTAVIDPSARLGRDVEIGPYAVIEGDTEIGDNCFIDSFAKIARYTSVGADSRIYMGAYIGAEPQDHRFKPGIESRTIIGSGCTLREYVTIHRSPFERGITEVGDGTLLMAFVHVGHDARIGRFVTVANQTGISGHVVIEDQAVLSACILIHQFCRIGRLAMIGARAILNRDVPPFALLAENECIHGANIIGLRRAGIPEANRTAIREAIRTYFFRGLNGINALKEIESGNPLPEIRHFADFIRQSTRGMMPGDPKIIATLSRGAVPDAPAASE